jgi:hypothetical protein
MPKPRSSSISRPIRKIRKSLLAIVAALDTLVPALDSRDRAVWPIPAVAP